MYRYNHIHAIIIRILKLFINLGALFNIRSIAVCLEYYLIDVFLRCSLEFIYTGHWTFLYQISREKIELEPWFEPRISGTPVQVHIILLKSDNVNFLGTNYRFVSINNLICKHFRKVQSKISKFYEVFNV